MRPNLAEEVTNAAYDSPRNTPSQARGNNAPSPMIEEPVREPSLVTVDMDPPLETADGDIVEDTPAGGEISPTADDVWTAYCRETPGLVSRWNAPYAAPSSCGRQNTKASTSAPGRAATTRPADINRLDPQQQPGPALARTTGAPLRHRDPSQRRASGFGACTRHLRTTWDRQDDAHRWKDEPDKWYTNHRVKLTTCFTEQPHANVQARIICSLLHRAAAVRE